MFPGLRSNQWFKVVGLAQVKSLVFGDLHLEHIKTWREAELGKLGYSLEFPLWHSSYKDRVVVSCALMLPVDIK